MQNLLCTQGWRMRTHSYRVQWPQREWRRLVSCLIELSRRCTRRKLTAPKLPEVPSQRLRFQCSTTGIPAVRQALHCQTLSSPQICYATASMYRTIASKPPAQPLLPLLQTLIPPAVNLSHCAAQRANLEQQREAQPSLNNTRASADYINPSPPLPSSPH
jgi:hypothetical protein